MIEPIAFIRDEMTRRRWTQRMLAHRSGVNHSTVSRLLGGQREPYWQTVVQLLSALGVTIELHETSEPMVRPDS